MFCCLLAVQSCRGELQGYCTNLKNQSQDLGERLERVQINFNKEKEGKEEAERELEVYYTKYVLLTGLRLPGCLLMLVHFDV